jgi:hypothetical protein
MISKPRARTCTTRRAWRIHHAERDAYNVAITLRVMIS